MGFITQDESGSLIVQRLGLNNIAFSWAYLFSFLLLLFALGFATIKLIIPLIKKNTWYILNHLRLWITLVAANFGVADQTHLRLKIADDEYKNIAYGKDNEITILPFEVKQTAFTVENYNAKLSLIDTNTSNNDKKNKNSFEITENTTKILKNWSITTLKYYSAARFLKNDIFPFDSIGTAPAVLVRAENVKTKEIKEGWISTGNELIEKSDLTLNDSQTLIMLPPTQKEMTLTVSILDKEKTIEKTIAVNSPQSYDGWKMYIFNFDDQKGNWSNSSIIELIRDKWQPFVYLGLAMLIIGSFFVFWRGK